MRFKIKDGIFEEITSFDNLLEAYYHARKGKRYRADALAFSAALEDNLFALRDELRSGTYKVGPYRAFYVSEPKRRLIMALSFRDRVVQWAIYLKINPYLEKWFMYDTYGCRKGKGPLAAADRLQEWLLHISRRPDAENWYCLKLDISKYFYRVDHEIILRLFRQIIADDELNRELAKIINNEDMPFGLPEGMRPEDCPMGQRLYDKGMPVGNLSSQMVGNLYLHPLDMFIKHVLRARYAIRYMDDIIILHNGVEELKEWLMQIDAFLTERMRLSLNAKTAIRPALGGISFVGYRIYPTHRKLSRRMATHIKRVFVCLAAEYARGNVDWEDIKETMNSYYALMEHADTYGLRTWIMTNVVFKREGELPEWTG